MSRDQINNIFNNEIVPSKKLPRPVTAKVQVKVTENSGNDQIPDFFFFVLICRPVKDKKVGWNGLIPYAERYFLIPEWAEMISKAKQNIMGNEFEKTDFVDYPALWNLDIMQEGMMIQKKKNWLPLDVRNLPLLYHIDDVTDNKHKNIDDSAKVQPPISILPFLIYFF